MDLTRLLEITLSSSNEDVLPNGLRFDETTCGSLCQHPSCWASQMRQEKGIPKLLSMSNDDSDSSSDELNLPKQSVCNLLHDYGESPTDRYPLSTGGRPSHFWETSILPSSKKSSRSLDEGYRLGAPPKAKWKKSGLVRNSRLRLVEVQEVFDRDDLNSQWDETFVTKPYYMWVPNPKAKRRKRLRAPPNTVSDGNHPVLMKDLTSCMVPPEIEHQREETILYDEWPVLKKKQQRTRSPPSRPVQNFQLLSENMGQTDISIDTEGINELLALPKEVLLSVLERTKKSDFTSKGRLHAIVQESARYDEKAQMALSTQELLQQKRMRLHKEPRWGSPNPPPPRPVFQLDDDEVLDRMSLVNTPVKDKDEYSEAESVETFPRYKKPLPGIQGHRKAPRATYLPITQRPKVPNISLGLPELPSGVRTTRPFSYKRQDFDFALGPIISGASSVRSSVSGDFSEHGTTVKAHAPSSAAAHQSENLAIHSVSPALSTNVPMAPAGTPATFMSPTKSTPIVREVTKDTAHLTVNTSERALPPSRDVPATEESFLSSPLRQVHHHIPMSPMETKLSLNADEVLDTINETARENQDSSVQSSRLGAGERVMVTPTEPAVEEEEVKEAKTMRMDEEERKAEKTVVLLETSDLRSIDTAKSPRAKSAKSVESCPSPEQWPLISESSFEKLAPRPSVSEPALSGRSDRRRPTSRGRDASPGKGMEKDYARKVMDEKRKAESPAPPPPSPEPKDPAERSEHRMRKDLKSRDSLTMAPLFEVSELEESSPSKGFHDNDPRGIGRQETTRTIQVTVPVAKSEGEEEKKQDASEHEEEDEKSSEELVSQITVLNVTPKGRAPGEGPKEKVQETFLNVDIPAEDISSLKAEHGSCHQEDISSNGTFGKSHSSTTGSETSVTPRAPLGKGDSPEGEGSSKLLIVSEDDNQPQGQNFLQNALDLPAEGGIDIKETQDALKDGEGQGMAPSVGSSGMSPEMLCDSARFISHELVSPDEDELVGDSTFVGDVLKNQLDQTLQEEDEALDLSDKLNMEDNDEREGSVAVQDSTSAPQVSARSAQDSARTEPALPGSFFFSATPVEEDQKEGQESGEKEDQEKAMQESEKNENAEQGAGRRDSETK